MRALDWDQEKIWTGKIVDPGEDLAKPYAGQEFNYRTRPLAAKSRYPNALGHPTATNPFFDNPANARLMAAIFVWHR
jgi:hypothetical protein